jgi:ketosteroid isomerase-like protein
MKRMTWLLLAVVPVACAPRSFDSNAEAAALLARDAEWAAVAAAGADVEKTISYWSDDAVIVPPGQPVVEGKAAIRTWVTDAFKIPGFKIRWASRDVRFSPDGQLAYMRGDSEMTVPGPDGQPTTISGRGITIWRHDTDGVWRCVVDTWNDPPAAVAK